MNRNRAAAALLIALAISPAFASEPEIAYRFLGDYVAAKEAKAGDKTGAYVMLGTGAFLAASSAAAWFYSDDISQAFDYGPIDPTLKNGLTLGFAIGSAASFGIGLGLYAAPPKNYRLEFASVFQESDPELREALAAATLRDLAIQAKQSRVAGALSSLLIPAIGAIIRVSTNVSEGKAWQTDLMMSISSNSWSLIGGITNLMTRSKEELLYERYLAARDALYDPRY